MFRKSLILVSFLFVLALAIIGCGGGGGSGTTGNPAGPVATPGATANLSGTVLFNNTPTPFAAVHLYKSEKAHTFGMAQLPSLKGSLLAQQIIGDGAYSTTTSAEGVYNFTDIPVGQYTLIAMRDDNHQYVQTGVLLGQVTTINPQLTPTGKITGKVTLSIGGTAQAIAGAFVYINGTSYIAVSDNTGNFTINNVPSNALTTSTAYEILVSSTRGTAAPVTGVVVSPGATQDIGTIAMTAPAQAGYATLNGSLVAGKGIADVSGIFVILTHKTSGTIFGTYTDSTGKFQFRVMETGDFLVICPEADYTFTPNSLTVNVAGLNSQTLTLSPITVDADQNEATGSISGSVSSLGSPFAGAIINVTGTSLLGISDSSGNFIINKVPVNTSLTPYTLELSSDKGTATRKANVIVNLGQTTAVGDFAITVPTAGYKNIVGTLTTTLPPNTIQLGNRLVQLTGPSGKVSAAYSKTSGGFSFMATEIGAHSVTVMDREFKYNPITQSIDVSSLDTAALPLTYTIDAALLSRTGTISGTVTKMGTPVAPVSGAIVSVTGASLIGVTNSAGNYVIQGVPVNVTPYTVEVSTNAGTAAPATGIMVTADQTTTVNFSVTAPPAYKTVNGRLTLSTVVPLPSEGTYPAPSPALSPGDLSDRLIQLSLSDGRVISAFTDSLGNYSFMATQSGPATVSVIDSDFIYTPRNQPVTIDLPFDNGNAPLVVPDIIVSEPVKPNSIVEGIVEWGTPAGNADFDGEVILESASFVDRRIVSNVSPAIFRFDNVPAGTYTLKTNPLKNGYLGATTVTLIEGVDLTGQLLDTTFIAPIISSVSPTGTVVGSNFGTTPASITVTVDDRPVTFTSLTDTGCVINLINQTPGEHVIQIHKTIPAGKVAGNKIPFTRTVQPPTGFAGSSTDTSITFTWQNAPYINEVDSRLLLGTTVVRPLKRIVGNSFTYSNLQASTTYTIEVTSTYPNTVPAAPVTFSSSTKQFGPQKPGLMTLAGSSNMSGTIFGFEMLNDKTYVAYYVETGTVYVQAYGADGAPIGTTYSTPYSLGTSAFDFCAGNNSLYLLCPNSSYQLEIQQLTPAADGSIPSVPAASATLTSFLTPEPNLVKIEFHGSNLFVSTRADMSATNVINVTRLSPTLTAPTNIYYSTSSLTPGGSPETWIRTAAEGSSGIYVAVATSPTPLSPISPSQFEILYAPAGASATQRIALIEFPTTISLISEFKINGPELIINSGLSNVEYLTVNVNNGVIGNLSYVSDLQSFGADLQGRLWALAGADAFSIVNLVNGQVANTFTVSVFPGESREFIKRQVGGSIMPNKFGMLHTKTSGELAVFYYDDSM